MKTCVRCNVTKKPIAFVTQKGYICKLCKAKKDIEKAEKYVGKEYISEKKLEDFEKITIISKNTNIVFEVAIEKFMEMAKEFTFKTVGEGLVYCTEFMNEFKEDTLTKFLILDRDNYICQYCGEAGDTIDHIFPQSQGGADHPINYLTACEICNSAKKDIVLNSVFEMKKLVRDYKRQQEIKERKREYGREIHQKMRERQEKLNQPIENVTWVEIQKEKENYDAVKKSSLDQMLANTFQKKKHTEKWR